MTQQQSVACANRCGRGPGQRCDQCGACACMRKLPAHGHSPTCPQRNAAVLEPESDAHGRHAQTPTTTTEDTE